MSSPVPTIIDLFVLRGTGPARLRNGFPARNTTDLGDLFVLDPISSSGTDRFRDRSGDLRAL